MTNNLVHFTPKHEIKREENLQKFIALCKDKLTVGEDQKDWSWDNHKWTFSNATGGMHFYKWKIDARKTKQITDEILLREDVLEIAKAYVRYTQNFSPAREFARIAVAFAAIEKVLCASENKRSFCSFSEKDLHSCFQLLEEYKNPGSIASILLRISRFFSENHIITGQALHWKSIFVGVNADNHKTGSRAPSEIKQQKLPDQDALLALADIFVKGYEEGGLDDRDTLITSIVALLMCTPMRISEILSLRTDCLHSDLDKDGNEQVYLKYFCSKIGKYVAKAIPTAMREVAIEAHKRLLRITESGRALSRHYENNYSLFYKHAECPSIDIDEPIHRTAALLPALNISSEQALYNYQKKVGVKFIDKHYSLNQVWYKFVLPMHAKLCPHFPLQKNPKLKSFKGLKMSESLLCFHYLQLHDKSSTSPVLLKEFSVRFIVQHLSEDRSNLNIFTKHGYPAYHLNSHSIRHYLNNLAFTSGVDLEMITLWSSRASIEQTLTYVDHDSILKSKTKDFTLNSENIVRNYLSPVLENSIQTLEGPFQRTQYGVCLRSWKTTPCNKVYDCLNCSEILICKRDKVAQKTISEERKNLQHTLDSAQAAIAQGERAAHMWISRMTPYLEKLTQLENVFNDDSIDESTMIQIDNCNSFSHEQAILDVKLKKAGLAIHDSSKDKKYLSDEALVEIKLLTGGGK